MKNKLPALLLVSLMVLPSLPPTAMAQSQPNIPPDVDPGLDTAETALDEAFVAIERYLEPGNCMTPFEQELLEGETVWNNATHRRATDDCVAQWGTGTYQRGSRSTLEGPALPTSHLAASDAPGEVLNTVAESLIQNGANPGLAARLVGGMADGCRFPGVASTGGSLRTLTAACRETLRGSTAYFQIPDAPAGAGSLYLEMHHAYDFSDPDANQRAVDGGWVEIRTPGEPWKRLDPIALFAPTNDAYGTLCAITGPPSVEVNRLTLGVGAFVPNLQQTWDSSTQDLSNQTPVPSPFDPLPRSQGEWRQDCAGILRSTYGTAGTPLSQDAAGESIDTRVPPRSTQRLEPYPGNVRGEGPGFVGDTQDENGRLEFIDHWFDLSSYAGETVEIRFHATGGAGLGGQQGGWWIDDMNVRYAGPPHDLSVRLETPEDGDSLPPGSSQITPGGEVPITAVARNLGRTPTQAATLQLEFAGASTNVSIPALEPLQKKRVTALMPLPDPGDANVTATLMQPSPQAGAPPTEHVDAFPLNDEDQVQLRIEPDQGASLSVETNKVEDDLANVTIEVENTGNSPIRVPLTATLTPIDLNTRQPRLGETIDLGPIANLTVPHGEDANVFGVQDPTKRISKEIDLPEPGLWAYQVRSAGALDIQGSVSLPFGEAAPTEIETTLASVSVGPTDETPRGGFELVDQDREGASDDRGPAAFRAVPYHPIDGPETRFVPNGDAAIASSGAELPEEWTPVRRGPSPTESIQVTAEDCSLVTEQSGDVGGLSSPVRGQIENVIRTACQEARIILQDAADTAQQTGEDAGEDASDQADGVAEESEGPSGEAGDRVGPIGNRSKSVFNKTANRTEETTGNEAAGGTIRDAGNTTANNTGDQTSTVGDTIQDTPGAIRGAGNATEEQLVNQSRTLADQLRTLRNSTQLDPVPGAEAQGTDDTRVPASLQAWNVRQHHVSIYGVGTKAEKDADEENNDKEAVEKALAQLRPREDGERVELAFEHAANVNWTNGQGSRARVLLIPKGDTDLIAQMRAFENATRELTRQLPPEGQAVANTVLMSLFFDAIGGSVEDSLRGLGVTRLPGDICTASPDIAGLGSVNALLGQICGEGQVLDSIEGACRTGAVKAQCDLANQGGSTYIRSGEETGSGFATEWRKPVGWENATIDITSLVENTTTEREEHGFYVIWDLVTMTNMEEIVASSQVTAPGEDESSSARLNTGTATDSPTVLNATAGSGWSNGERPLWTVDDARLERVLDDQVRAQWCLEEDGTAGRCEAGESVPVLTTRGWKPYPEEAGTELPWSFDRRGGDPGSLDPGALVWKGGTGRLSQTTEGPRTAIDLAEPDSYSVLRAPTVDLSGYKQPVAKMHVQWGEANRSLYEDLGERSVEHRCENARSNETGTVWTRTGWNARARPVLDNGSLGPAKTVHPIGGYHECSDVGEVPILFNGTGVLTTPHFVDHAGRGSTEPTSHFVGTYERSQCAGETKTDPLQFCSQARIQFGHGQPVYALPMTWQDVAFDLSEFQGQEVQIEIHAFGIHGDPPAPGKEGDRRGELRLDSFKVTENQPPVDLAASHEKRPFIAPGSEEKFNLTIENAGSEPVTDVWVRRTIIDGQTNCQPDEIEPVVIHRTLRDQETGEVGVPPGSTNRIVDGRLAWKAPDEQNRLFQRQLSIATTDELGPSQAPVLSVDYFNGAPSQDVQEAAIGTDEENHPEDRDTRVAVSAVDPDDCREDMELEVVSLAGNPDIEENGLEIQIRRPVQEDQDDEPDDTDETDQFTAVKVSAKDKHDAEALPAFISPPPRFVFGERDPRSEDTTGGPFEDVPVVGSAGDEEDAGPVLDPVMENAGSATAQVLQSPADADGTGSLVRVTAQPADPDLGSKLVLPCDSGIGCTNNLLFVDDNAEVDFGEGVEIHGLAPGHYFGYVLFGSSDYAPVEFTIRELSKAGQDARPGDNEIELRGQTRSLPSLRIDDIGLDRTVVAGEPVEVPIKIVNDGNVPLEGVTSEITIRPGDISKEANRIPLLDPGESATTSATVEIARPGPFRVEAQVSSEIVETTGTRAQDATGTGLLVLEEQSVRPEPGDHTPWQIGEEVAFGDGNRVPRNTNASLPLTGQMDLSRSPLSALSLNHSGELEKNYDGITLEWRTEDGTINHELEDSLTSSHAGGVPGQRTDAFTGELNHSLAWSTDLSGIRAKEVDDVQADEWKHRGGFRMEADAAFLDGSESFWLPTATTLGDDGKGSATTDQIVHRLRIPITKGEWCTISDEMVPFDVPFRIRTLERRMFSERTSETRGWDATVRLAAHGAVSKSIPGEPVVPLADQETSGWSSVEYEIPLTPLFPAITAGTSPFSLGAFYHDADTPGHDTTHPTHKGKSACEQLDEHPSKQDELSQAEIVFELKADPSTVTEAAGGLDVGWFVSQVEAPELGLTVGASGNNHVAQRCFAPGETPPSTYNAWPPSEAPIPGSPHQQEAPDSSNTRRSIMGCTEMVASDQVERGSLDPLDDEDPSKISDSDRDQVVQRVTFSGNSAVNQAGAVIDPLTDLLSERTFEDAPGDAGIRSKQGDGWFRYLDATALVDLRAGTKGAFVVQVNGSSQQGIAQVVAAPIEPGEASSEQAPTRVPWTPLKLVDDTDLLPGTEQGVRSAEPSLSDNLGEDLCEPAPLGPGQPRTLLGGDRTNIVGPVDGFNTSLAAQDALCADLSPVAGELALVGLRVWLPEPQNDLQIGDASAWMAVPQPRTLAPQLRALTDDTVHEGTYTLNDAALLSMAPPFSHNVQAELSATQNWTLEDGRTRDVLISNSFPDLTINVTEPGKESQWNMTVEVNVTYQEQIEGADGGGTNEVHVAGELDLDEDTFRGSHTIRIPWEKLREPLDGWLSRSPVLPSNVTQVDVFVNTTANDLLDPFTDCPSDLVELAESDDLQCRRLADLVSADDQVHISYITEDELEQEPGVQRIDVRPDRAPPGSPRTAHVEIVNPSSTPVEVRGNLTLEDGDQEELERTPFPTTIVRPWQTRTLEIPLTIPDDEPTRVRVVADVGETSVEDDYRTTTAHASTVLTPFFFDDSDSGVTETAEAARPSLAGQDTDGFGWQLRSTGGQARATVLETNFIPVEAVQDMLTDPENVPVFSFQHQRALRGNQSTAGGDYSYMAVSVCGFGGCNVLDGWAPETSQKIKVAEDNQDPPSDLCTEATGPSTQGQSEVQAQGIESGTSPVFYGSTGAGTTQPDLLDAWQTAMVPVSPQDIPTFGSVQFHIILGDCRTQGESTILVDDVSLSSARPLVSVGADEIPIRPGAEKRYRFAFENNGAGSETFRFAPSATLPSGWELTIELADGNVVYDSTDETTVPVEMQEGERIDGVFRLKVPGTESGGIERAVPITAYAIQAPGVMSDGAFNASAHTDDQDKRFGDSADPGRVRFGTARVDQPDLRVDPTSVNIEDAEVGRQAKIQFKISNDGRAKAEDVPISVSINGPSGFQTLEAPGGGTVREDFPAGSRKFLTYTWVPQEPGEHRLRVVADPGPDDVDILVDESVHEFFGLVQESEECDPSGTCANVADIPVDVAPLQKPELSVTVKDVPDRISAGEETTLKVIVRNAGGRTATDATLTLSENGLLPILETLAVDLPEIEPGNQTVLTPEWTPVTPGDILVLASVSAPGEFTGQRGDGSSAGSDNDAAIPVHVDRSRISVTLSEPIRTEPGLAHVVEATVTNDGTSTATLSPTTVTREGVFLSPVLDAPMEVPPGEERTVPLLGFARLGTTPRTVQLEIPLDQGQAKTGVTALSAPGARVILDERPTEPGKARIDARVINEGNVPLDGTLAIRGQGIAGDVDIDVPVGETVDVTIPTAIAPGVAPGSHRVATNILLDEERLTDQHRLRIEGTPAVEFDLEADKAPLAGSATGTLAIRNIGNEALDGRLILEGPATLTGSPVLDLAPGKETSRTITWLSSANRTGTATVVGFEDEPIASTALSPDESGADLELVRVTTRPSVNLRAGMAIQVVGTVENHGTVNATNTTLGITIDGELYKTFTVENVIPGEATVVTPDERIELPRSGELTIGLVDLTAFQRGETAGPATTIQVGESGFGLGTIQSIPTIPWYLLIGLAVLVAGGKRR